MQNLNTIPWDTEHFNNKSIQRKIFDESIRYHLKGDDDNFDASLIDNQTSFRATNMISSNQIGINDVQNQQQQTSHESQLDTYQQYIQKSQFSHKLSENSDKSQQVGVLNNPSKQKINEINLNIKLTKEKKVYLTQQEKQNTIICSLDHQSNLFQASKMNFMQKNSDLNDSFLSEIEIKNSNKCMQQDNLGQIKTKQEAKKLSVYNYQKAANIIHNVFGKSANRVQRVDQQVKNFISILKYLKQNRRLPQLEDAQFLLLKDLSYFYQINEQNKIKRLFTFFILVLSFFRIPFPLFMPTDTFRIYWNFIQVFFIYTFLYIYSILLFFCSNEQDSNYIRQYFKGAFIFFLLDIMVNFNTSYFDKDAIIKKRKKIAWRYINSSVFVTDSLCVIIIGSKIIFDVNFIYNPNSTLIFFVNLLLFTKLNGCQEKRNSIYMLFNLTENDKHLIRLCNQLISVLFVAHFVSLSWYLLGSYEVQNGYQVSWLQKFNLLDLTYLEKYIYSMYWSITTMTTEQKDRNLQAENNILKVLSKKLRDEITIEVNQRILKNNSIFQKNFSEQTLVKLAFIMEEVQISPNEIIFEQGDSEDQSIYLIESGIIEIYQLLPPHSNINKVSGNNNFHILKQLKKKDQFGEISFFSGLARKANARSLNLSTLYKIDRSKFITVLKENNEDLERFKMIEEQIKVQKDLSSISLECYACKIHGHLASDCPNLHQKFDSQFQILKHNYSIFQNRQKADRRKNKQNPKQVAQYNPEICKNLKNQLRNFNTIVEGYFKTELDFLAQISQKDVDKTDQEYQTSTEQSSNSLGEDEPQFSIDQQQKESIFQVEKQKSSIQQRFGEKQRIDSIVQNSDCLESIVQNQNEQIANQAVLKNQQSTKSIQNMIIDSTQSKSFSNNEQANDSQKTETENEAYQEEVNQGISIQDQLLPSIMNSKTQIQIQKTNSNANVASNLSSSEINQNLKKLEKKNSKQTVYQSKKIVSQDDCQSSNPSDEETIKPIQHSFSKKKSIKNKVGTKKDLQEQISKTSFEILNSINGNILKNLVYQNSQKSIQTINTINMQDDNVDDLSKINYDQTNRNKYEQYSSQLIKQNHSQKSVNFNVNQNDQNENSFVCKSLKVLGLPSQLISSFSNQKEMLEQIGDILRKSRKDFSSFSKYSQRQLDEQQNYNNFSLNNFDKMQYYKRFFPHNNFSHIFNKFSYQKLTELKKIKQSKTMTNKGRRNNILMTSVVPRKSLFCNIGLLQNNFPSEINLDSYKPTFLSYGVCSKDCQIYPKSNQNNRILHEIYKR
ncbi:hypothetical protein ABPG72_020251 [Tetrahymena utriculariae]